MPRNDNEQKKKTKGKVYTPANIVSDVLDIAGYTDDIQLLKQSIIDPACGDGALLIEIVSRYISYANKHIYSHPTDFFLPPSILKQWLVESIYGIDIDEEEVKKAKKRMADTANRCMPELDMIPEDFVNVITGDTIQIMSDNKTRDKYIGQFDFVVGNPPYVRIHNLNGSENLPTWCDYGMTDLYYAFFQLGLDMLREQEEDPSNNGHYNGINSEETEEKPTLCYIAPSSWFTNKAAAKMRKELYEGKNIDTIVDLQHQQVFESAQTYTAIVKMTKPFYGNSVLNKQGKGQGKDRLKEQEKTEKINYCIYSSDMDYSNRKAFLTSCDKINYSDAFAGGYFIPTKQKYVKEIKEILEEKYLTDNEDIKGTLFQEIQSIQVKNGFATNLDSFYIRPSFPPDFAPEGNIIKVIKASTGHSYEAFFPYEYVKQSDKAFDSVEKAITPLEDLKDKKVFTELHEKKDELIKRTQIDAERHWYVYARTQGIADVNKYKVAMNMLYRNKDDIKICEAEKGTGIYGGIYILGLCIEDVKKAVLSEEYANIFMEYVKCFRKYKSGGYYTISGKELEKYLRWWLKNKITCE